MSGVDLFTAALVRDYMMRKGYVKSLEVLDREQAKQPEGLAEEAWYSVSTRLDWTGHQAHNQLKKRLGQEYSTIAVLVNMVEKRYHLNKKKPKADAKGKPKASDVKKRRRKPKKTPDTMNPNAKDLAFLEDPAIQRALSHGRSSKNQAMFDKAAKLLGGVAAGSEGLGKSGSAPSLGGKGWLQPNMGFIKPRTGLRLGDQKSSESWIPMDVRMRMLKRDMAVAEVNRKERMQYDQMISKKRAHWKNQTEQAKNVEKLTRRSKKKKTCALCELEFAECNLPFVVSYKAIMDIRKAWGVTIQPNVKYGTFPHWYQPVKTCVFCSQFLQLQGGLFDSQARGKMKADEISKDDVATLHKMGISLQEAQSHLLGKT